VPAYETPTELRGPIPGYEISERLGKGTTGVVYLARELATGNLVALKVLLPVFHKNPTLVERFRREAQIAAAIEHPNVRRVFGGGDAGGLLYLAMEYVEGETLEAKIAHAGALAEGDALRAVAQVARAMDYYSKLGVLHRDVKPANILVTAQGVAKLCDLGLSKRVYEDFALTMQGTTLGSPFYISPEQGLGTTDLDVRSDIYSLGISLFHCLTGRVPFVGPNAGVIISKHHREPLPDVRRFNPLVSPACAALVAKMAAKRPDERHQSPRELLAEIAWIRSEAPDGRTPIAPIELGEESLATARAALEGGQPLPKKGGRGGLFRRMLRAIGW
jgi:serine/threonine-protein kinase